MQTALTQPAPSNSLTGFASTLPGKVLLGLAATAVVAAAAHIVFPLPFTPVPFILTPLAVLGVGLALGPVAGFFTMLAYLAEGAIGLPVFSPTGLGSAAQILGPTGGFLMAYPVVAAITGFVARKLESRIPRFLAATIAGTLAITVLFLSGASWFMHLTHLSLPITLSQTVLPFLPGEAIKILAAAGIYSTLRRAKQSPTPSI
jgi:biotin transport system substrate-specific component